MAAAEVAAGSKLIVAIAAKMAPAGATSQHRIATHALAPLILRVHRPAVVAAVARPPHHPHHPLRPLRPRRRLAAADAANSKRIAETVAKMALGGAICQQTIVRSALAPSMQVPPPRAAAAAVGLRLRLSQLRLLRPLRLRLLRRVRW